MNSIWKVVKIVIGVFSIIFCGILIYLVVDLGGDAKGILAIYQQVEGGKGDISKQLQFMKEYIQITGDITIALNTGLTKEQIDDLIDEGNPDDKDKDKDPEKDPQGGRTNFDSSNVDSAIASHCSSWGSKTSDWTYYNHGGSVYIWENQNGSWGNVKEPGGSTMQGAGCMWFVLSCAKSNVSGTVYGVEDILTDCGYTAKVDSAGSWSVSPKLPCVGQDSGKSLTDGTKCTIIAIGNKIGLNIEADKGSLPNSSSLDLNNNVYLCHVKNDNNLVIASGSMKQHWFLLVGSDGTNYQLANVKNGKEIISINTMNNLEIDHCYKIKR